MHPDPSRLERRAAELRERFPGALSSNDAQVQLLAFVGAFMGVWAASDGDLWKITTWAASIGTGCGAVLALRRQVGQGRPPQGEIRG